jgi:hypothetical protein
MTVPPVGSSAPVARRLGRLAATLLGATLTVLALAAPVGAFEVTSFTAEPASDQAGARSDFNVSFDVELDPLVGLPFFFPDPNKVMSTVVVELPPGVMGEIGRFPECSTRDFFEDACPKETQVGTVTYEQVFVGEPNNFVVEDVSVVKAGPGQAGVLGFSVAGPNVVMETGVRSGTDYGLTTTATDLPGVAVVGMDLTLWGRPADHGTGGPAAPFMANPTQCEEALVSTLRVRSYGDPDEWHTRTFTAPPLTGCDEVPFDPDIRVEATHPAAGSPTGLDVDVTVPESASTFPIQSAMRKAEVTLPDGMSLSPAVAAGLEACSDEQFARSSAAMPSCPLASKIGTSELEVAALRQPLEGSIYIGSQLAQDPYRIFVSAQGQGVTVKLSGSIVPDPVTGRLTAVFDDNPQVTFKRLSLRFKGGSRAPLVNSPVCGAATTTARFTGYNGSTVTASHSYAVSGDGQGSPCPSAGFTPDFSAGSTNPAAGRTSGFSMSFGRADGDALLQDIAVDLPEGLLGHVGSVPLCPDFRAALGTCDEASRIGSAETLVGAGTDPLHLAGGRVYLTGPYKGAPYGLSVAVPAQAGPYDLGTVVVRSALHVDPRTAAVRVVSDPLPTILQGIPLQIRRVDVSIDRDGFMTNPTDCSVKRVAARVGAFGGAFADVASRFQVGDCAALRFTPKLALRLTGKGQRREGGHPGLRAVLTQPAGQANVDRVKVTLPKSVALDPDNANGLCSYEDGLKASCPASSRIGTARAGTPLLSRPIAGPVYLVQGVRFDRGTGARIRTTPTLLVTLRGEIAIDLRATTTSKGGKLVSTFASVPDAAVSKFDLRLKGGNGGILAATGRPSLCAGRHTAAVDSRGHNGRTRTFDTRIKTPCPKRRAKRGPR